MRDRADDFADADCFILGASYDTPGDNKIFADAQNFGFRLLSDVDRQVATAYDVVRPDGDPYPDFPKRMSFLIDPDGVIQRVYDVTDVAGHAGEVLDALGELQAQA